MTLTLVCDIGTTGTKAAILRDSTIIASTTHTYPTYQASGGVVEQSVTDWIEAFRSALQTLDDVDQVDSIILTGQMQDVILLDAEANPVAPVILYSDGRAHEYADELDHGALRKLTGNIQDAGSLIAKLQWLNAHDSTLRNKVSHLVFGAADAIAAQLTGEFVTDSTTASTTGLLNLQSRDILDQEQLRDLQLTYWQDVMPRIVAGGSQVGSVQEYAAQQFGIRSGIPVYLAPGDAGSATIGAGSGEIGTAYAYVGTSGWVAFTANEPANPEQDVITLAHPQEDRFIQIAPTMMAAGNLDWICSRLQFDDISATTRAACERDVTPLLYLPYLNGERSPFRDVLARGTFIGLSASTEPLDIIRSVLEGVCFSFRHMLDALAPDNTTTLVLTGGAAQSSSWAQLFADVLGLPIYVLDEADNVGIFGAYQAVQVQSGHAVSYNRELTHTAIHMPQHDQYQWYSEKYEVFRDMHTLLKPTFARLGAL